MTWVCDKCHGEMQESSDGKNRKRIYCPNCGEVWYVDNNDEYINE